MIDNPLDSLVQTALLGNVPSSLRAVMVRSDAHHAWIRAVFDGEISPQDRESMACVETEVIAGLADEDQVSMTCVRVDSPAPIPWEGTAVFQRREP